MSEEKKVVEVPAKFKALVEEIEKMSVLDLSELVKILEEKFGVSASAPAMMMAAPAAAAPVAAAPAAAPAAVNENAGLLEIKSPMVGTFYRSPSPDSDVFVQVGQDVTADTVVCIIEAMKVMNEIQSEVKGKIKKILVDNATPVQFGQALFLVEPA